MKTTKKLTVLMAAFIFAFAFAVVKPEKVQAATYTLTLEDNHLTGTGKNGEIDVDLANDDLFFGAYVNDEDKVILEIKGTSTLKSIGCFVDLTIKGSGTVNCEGSIGAVNLTINSGTINARGISDFDFRGGDITINGGTIKITGESWVASIYTPDSIIINGGDIEIDGKRDDFGLYADEQIIINGGDVKATGEHGALFAGGDVVLGDGVKEINNLQITEIVHNITTGKGINAKSAHFIYDAGSQGGNNSGGTDPQNNGGATTNDTPADPNKAPKTNESHTFVLSMLGIIAVAGMGLYVGKKQEN